MPVVPTFCFVAGATILSFGFIKNNRALLVTAAFLWLAAGTWDDFSHGFKDGWSKKAPTVATSRGA